ncbi:nucleotidyltransferase domain-containing protein [Bradyrhizobium sp. NP1]|uniref:nucleotidyltransferase domain-containing protein n=1 Tax=Bradyrhizobium sp. NP1 TaxID=3049772 RepID=UPI0025A61E43|nr:nucleotidyltransferase domain-containing protein [Bradyrhizobium sp. NP1]WJR80274.1 nucleotidyltransferase domain-containing protein [Bradyrhizobium sp. NP1]
MQHDEFLRGIVAALAQVPGIEAIVLGGSRARGSAGKNSDYDIGLYFSSRHPLDTERLLAEARGLADEPEAAVVTPVGEWGPWIVGGAWLSISRCKVDLLYREVEAVARVIEGCRAGSVSMDYQPGHPHGFCSAIWAGEAALCRPLHDPHGVVAGLKAIALPYPKALRAALIRRFRWEVSFSIDNAELAAARGEQTHVAGCVYRALACSAQVLFAINERYLINEKGALQEAAGFHVTIPDLAKRVDTIWRSVGEKDFGRALSALRAIAQEAAALSPRDG